VARVRPWRGPHARRARHVAQRGGQRWKRPKGPTGAERARAWKQAGGVEPHRGLEGRREAAEGAVWRADAVAGGGARRGACRRGEKEG